MALVEVSDSKEPQPKCEFNVPPELGLRGLGSLICLGIKFFLYQRGQLSVPFDALHTSEAAAEIAASQQNDENPSIPDDIVNPRERLRFLKIQKVKMRQERLKAKRKTLEIRNEINARASLDTTFEVLAGVFSTLSASLLLMADSDVAIVLITGSSVYSAKEFVIFKINLGQGISHSSPVSMDPASETRVTKRFYKTVIMSSHFGDFVAKRQSRSTSHLILMTDKSLPDDILSKHSLSILENVKLPEMSSGSSHRFSRFRPNVFYINLNLNMISSTFSPKNPISSYHTYGIPMSFRGMRKHR